MAAIPPNNNLEGLIASLKDGIYGAYNKGVKYGRYLALQEYLERKESAQPKWISVEERLPEICDLVLVVANGKPRENIELYNAILIASYWGEEGWIADGFDGWDKLNVSFWMPLPSGPKEG